MNLKSIVDELQKKYSFDIEEFMDLYTRKMTRIEIGERLGLSPHTISVIGDRMNVKWPKSKRAKYRVQYLIEYNADATNEGEVGEDLQRENEYLSNKLGVSQKALQRSRDEANHLRSEMRKNHRKSALDEEVLDLIEKALPIKHTSDKMIHVNTPTNAYAEHTSCILLSDLHCEESVSRKDVGNTNEYTWDVAKERLDKVFQAWFNAWRGEEKGVVILAGDLFTGLIHDSLENNTLHPVEAVQELADIMYDYILGAALIFENVHVPVVNGNHSRISEHIKSHSKGFDLEYVFGHILKAKLSSVTNVNVEISTVGYITTKVGEKILGIHHGDNHRGNTNQESRTFKVYEAFKNVLQVDVDHICQGHTHQFSHTNTHKGSMVVNGSLIGSNTYGHISGFTALRPSQTLMSFTHSGEVDIVKQVFVDK